MERRFLEIENGLYGRKERILRLLRKNNPPGWLHDPDGFDNGGLSGFGVFMWDDTVSRLRPEEFKGMRESRAGQTIYLHVFRESDKYTEMPVEVKKSFYLSEAKARQRMSTTDIEMGGYRVAVDLGPEGGVKDVRAGRVVRV